MLDAIYGLIVIGFIGMAVYGRGGDKDIGDLGKRQVSFDVLPSDCKSVRL